MSVVGWKVILWVTNFLLAIYSLITLVIGSFIAWSIKDWYSGSNEKLRVGQVPQAEEVQHAVEFLEAGEVLKAGEVLQAGEVVKH